MAVNQPIITGNQADDSWRLEVTSQLNNEEARVNALASQVAGTAPDSGALLNGSNTFTGNNTFDGSSIFNGVINTSQPFITATLNTRHTTSGAETAVVFDGTTLGNGSGVTLLTNDTTFRIDVAGIYLVNITLQFSNLISGTVNLRHTRPATTPIVTNNSLTYTQAGTVVSRVILGTYNSLDTLQLLASMAGTNSVDVQSTLQIYKIG